MYAQLRHETKEMAQLKRLHKDDQAQLTAKSRAFGGRVRLEFKDCIADMEWPEWLPDCCRPMHLTADQCDSGSETLLPELRIPTTGEFWMDVQVAEYIRGNWEPMNWFRADFNDGRLTSIS